MIRSKFEYILYILIIGILNHTTMLVRAKKCKVLENVNICGTYVCKGVQTLSEIDEELTPSWCGIIVINEQYGFLDIEAQSGERRTQTKWAQITELDLSRAGALSLGDDGFSAFSSLERLNITNSQIADFDVDHFSTQSKLKYLDATGNDFAKLKTSNFQRLTQLKVANFSNNDIKRIEADTFSRLLQLEFLNLNHNALMNASIGACSGLKELTMTNNDIKKLSVFDFAELPQLQYLSLSGNSITDIEDGSFELLTELRELNLERNNLHQISAETFRCTVPEPLQHLDLSLIDFKSFNADIIKRLSKLQILNLARNQIDSLPAQLFKGHRVLRTLYLQGNYISTIDAHTFANLSFLDMLDLSDNQIQRLDEYIFGTRRLSFLRVLSLKNNNLQHIHPRALEFLPSLGYLTLRRNELTTLDVGVFASVERLRKLNIGDNLLGDIPEELLSTLKYMTDFYLDNNKLSFLPPMTLPNVTRFFMEGNSWQCNCLDELFDWLHERNIEYFRRRSLYYRGERPLCAVTDEKVCIRNLTRVKEMGVLELFDSVAKGKATK